jgi:hypothetical protein
MKFLVSAIGVFALWVALGASSALAEARVQVGYGEAGDDPNLAHARDVIMKSQALEELQTFLAPLRLPSDLTIQAVTCGAERMAYDPRSKTATVCYEMIAKILGVVAAQTDASEQDKRDAIVGTIVESLFHEVAYALFDLYKVPVWGRVEDAADRFSALVMMKFGEDNARTTILGAARFFAWSARTWTGSDFSAVSAPEAQRFYNFLCIAYGGDPITFDNLATGGALPEYRAPQCAREYAQIRDAFNLRLMPFVDPDRLVKARARTW